MEAEAGEADEPGFPVAGEAVQAGGIGGGESDRGDCGRAGLSGVGGQQRAAGVDLQVSGPDGGLARGGRGVLAGYGGEGGAGAGGADGGGPDLGEGGQGGVPADRVVCPVGFQNSATGPDLAFYAARSYSLMRPPRTGRRLIRLRERSATGWSGRGGRSWRLR